MKIFDVKVYDRYDVIFRLAVCGTRKEMHAAIAADAKKQKRDKECLSGTMGMFRPAAAVMDSARPGTYRSNVFGTMFLNLADLNDEILVHECGHAAFAWENGIRLYTHTFDDDSMGEQEEFCYFLGKAAAKVREIIKQNFKTARGKI